MIEISSLTTSELRMVKAQYHQMKGLLELREEIEPKVKLANQGKWVSCEANQGGTAGFIPVPVT
jgi:hypothetical protein